MTFFACLYPVDNIYIPHRSRKCSPRFPHHLTAPCPSPTLSGWWSLLGWFKAHILPVVACPRVLWIWRPLAEAEAEVSLTINRYIAQHQFVSRPWDRNWFPRLSLPFIILGRESRLCGPKHKPVVYKHPRKRENANQNITLSDVIKERLSTPRHASAHAHAVAP